MRRALAVIAGLALLGGCAFGFGGRQAVDPPRRPPPSAGPGAPPPGPAMVPIIRRRF